jgi:hypothetical protein
MEDGVLTFLESRSFAGSANDLDPQSALRCEVCGSPHTEIKLSWRTASALKTTHIVCPTGQLDSLEDRLPSFRSTSPISVDHGPDTEIDTVDFSCDACGAENRIGSFVDALVCELCGNVHQSNEPTHRHDIDSDRGSRDQLDQHSLHEDAPSTPTVSSTPTFDSSMFSLPTSPTVVARSSLKTLLADKEEVKAESIRAGDRAEQARGVVRSPQRPSFKVSGVVSVRLSFLCVKAVNATLSNVHYVQFFPCSYSTCLIKQFASVCARACAHFCRCSTASSSFSWSADALSVFACPLTQYLSLLALYLFSVRVCRQATVSTEDGHRVELAQG